MLKELDEMSIGQKLYNYECESCDFEKVVLKFLIEEFREDDIFVAGVPINENTMTQLLCLSCVSKFEYKKTDDR